jgi:cephalosporin-C deacetylase
MNIPEDLDAFWADVVKEANAVPLDYKRSLTNDYERPGFVVETLRFTGMEGRSLNGWIAYPEGARRLPSFLWLAPYGRESKVPDQYGTREGFTSLSFNFHGEGAYHQEKYDVARGYFAHGAEDPESWIFRRMFQDAIIATRVLQAQVEADEDRIGAMGMSQGGGMAIWLGAWSPIIKAVCSDMPFLSDIERTLSGDVYRYPLKEVIDYMDTIPVGRERVLNTVQYFDTAHQATRCDVPTQVSLGLRDPASRPDSVRKVFEALPGNKRMISYDWGHDWHPDMVENNRQWLAENLR